MHLTEVVGHAALLARLEHSLREDRLAHATLLVGPDGVGKTSIAERLAGLALDAEAWPGGLQAHPDHWIEDSTAERISIERVRAGGGTVEAGPSLQDFLALTAYAGGRRVAVVGRADRLTEQAANCLLKTLEEPPPLAHLVLCAAHPERLPATVVSRCQAFTCAPVPAAEISTWLARRGVEERLARLAASLAAGRPGRALALASATGVLEADMAAIDALLATAGGGRSGALQAAGRLAPPNTAEGRERALGQVAAWTSFLRDVVCLNAGAPELVVWAEYRPAAEAWAEALPRDRTIAMLQGCVDVADQVAQYAVPRLCFEVLFLDVFAATPAPPRAARSGHLPAAPATAGTDPPTATTARPRPGRRRG